MLDKCFSCKPVSMFSFFQKINGYALHILMLSSIPMPPYYDLYGHKIYPSATMFLPVKYSIQKIIES